MAVAETTKFDWTHPSWRDVVINYIMTHPADRLAFLSSCGIVGIELALSTSGGSSGERERPLLQVPEDWEGLARRVLALIPHWTIAEHVRLLHALSNLVLKTDAETMPGRSCMNLLRAALVGIRDAWNRRSESLPPRVLATYYAATVTVDPLMQGPDLEATWQEQMATLAGADAAAVRRGDTLSALEFVVLLTENEPRFLRSKRWAALTDDSVRLHVEDVGWRADEVRTTLAAAEEGEAERDDVEYAVVDATSVHRRALLLRRLGVLPERDPDEDVIADIEDCLSGLEQWLESDAERAAEEYVEQTDEDEFEETEVDEEPTPQPLTLAQMFSDL